ncbi:polysaccharide biosynthesis tyrosine autokinase [Elusimicrobiota bacterium]
MYNKKAASNQIKIQHVLGLISRRRWFIIIPISVSLILSLVMCLILPRSYEASSMVLVKSKKIIDPLVSQFAVSPDIREFLNTLSKQVLAWPRLQQLAAQLKVTENTKSPVELERYLNELKSRINVSLKGKELIQIQYWDRDPVQAQKVVNTLTLNFIEENARIKKQEALNAIDFLNEQLVIYRKKLGDSQKNFSSSKIDTELRLAYNRKKLLEERLTGLQKLIPSQIRKEQSPVIEQLNAQLGKYEAELARIMIDAKEGNPRVYELKKIIAELKRKIDGEKEKETIKESVSISNPVYLQSNQDLRRIEMEINYLEKRKKELKENKQDAEEPVTEVELAALERDKRVDEDIYQMLLEQLEAAYVSERLQDSEKGSRFTVIEYARLPISPVRPNKFRVVLMGLFLGCVVVASLVYTAEYLDKSVMTVEDAKDFLPQPVLGTISKMLFNEKIDEYSAEIQDKPGIIKSLMINLYKTLSIMPPVSIQRKENSVISPEIVFHHGIMSKAAEEYRLLWTNILGLKNVKEDKAAKTIMLTSSIVGEGKSVSSGNMAAAMAYAGKNTLLIDCDLRRGCLHDIFGIPRSPGIIDVFKSSANIELAIHETEIKNLSLAPIGSEYINPAELFNLDKLEWILEKVKKKYEIIIVDSPPVLNLSDSVVIGKFVDMVLVVVQMERTPKEDIIETYNSLAGNNINVSGFILNGIRYYMPSCLYNYYYGSYGYGSYGKQ